MLIGGAPGLRLFPPPHEGTDVGGVEGDERVKISKVIDTFIDW